jgi:hypothetical protein
MNSRIETGYMHKLGPVVISTGIGEHVFYPFAVKKTGSLKRILPAIKGSYNPGEILGELHIYVGNARKPVIWAQGKKNKILSCLPIALALALAIISGCTSPSIDRVRLEQTVDYIGEVYLQNRDEAACQRSKQAYEAAILEAEAVLWEVIDELDND